MRKLCQIWVQSDAIYGRQRQRKIWFQLGKSCVNWENPGEKQMSDLSPKWCYIWKTESIENLVSIGKILFQLGKSCCETYVRFGSKVVLYMADRGKGKFWFQLGKSCSNWENLGVKLMSDLGPKWCYIV